MVSNGDAFSISIPEPESGMHKHRVENTVVLPFDDFDPNLATGMIWRRNRTASQPDLQRLIEPAKSALH
ncbi:hypothetical protein [Saccharopolyspora spinosa]|uniref:hypothetical protein n=1 Tax=Saccharopolyspora spinosa TaxID=60894 RepID=UPI003BAC4BC4